MKRLLSLSCLSLLLIVGELVSADECAGFKWDVRKEQALFAGPSGMLAAGKDLASAPVVGPDKLYQLQLQPQATVAYALAPGKTIPPDGLYGGLAILKLAQPGHHYRVALDLPFWIDLVANGKLAAAVDFQGQRGCDAPHKIVEFDLDGAKDLILQLSGAGNPMIHLSVTKVPPTKS